MAVIPGTAGDDILQQNPGEDDQLDGLGGVDTIDLTNMAEGARLFLALSAPQAIGPGQGMDSVRNIENAIGTDFNDLIVGVNGGSVLYGGDGEDQLQGRGGDDDLNGYIGDDLLIGAAGDDNLFGSSGKDVLRGGLGTNIIDGSSGFDRADYSVFSAGVNVSLAAGTATPVANDGSFSDTLISIEEINASAGDDVIIGNDSVNKLFGLEGNDFIDAGLGNDTLSGGDGDDIVVGGGGRDYVLGGRGNDWLITGLGRTTAVGEEGVDTVDYSGFSRPDGMFINIESRRAFYNDGSGDINDRLYEFENVVGTDGTDTIIGNAEANDLKSRGGDDYIDGKDNDDVLDGAGGDDTIIAGAGNDTVTGGDGNDVIQGREGLDLLNGDAGDDNILGGDDADTINGGDGDDTLYGDGGNDAITGGTGNDIAYGGLGSDNIHLNHGTGQTAFGQDGNDILKTWGNGDVLHGGIGDDDIRTTGAGSYDSVFNGDDGHDVLISYGNASDPSNMTLNGGAGDDEIYLNGKGDEGYGGDGADRIRADGTDSRAYGGDGNDTLSSYQTFGVILYGEAGDDNLAAVFGGNTIMYGGIGNDTLRFATARAEAYGGDGNDQFVFENTLMDFMRGSIVEGGGGLDTVDFSGWSSSIGRANFFLSEGATLGRVELPDNLDPSDIVLATLLDVENVIGADEEDFVLGNSSSNNLNGKEGNDQIFGLGGNDTLIGDAGDDYLDGGGGDDLVQGLAGDDQLFDGTGNDQLEGGDGNDQITLYGGDDVALGGMGADEFFVRVGNHQIFGGAETDTVFFDDRRSDNSYRGWNLDLATSTGGGQLPDGTPISVTFDSVEKFVLTNSNDTFNGSAGDDIVDLREGNDLAVGGTGHDIISSGQFDGVNDVSDNDIVRGGDGNDVLLSMVGNDFLYGESGDDALFFAHSSPNNLTGHANLDGGTGADTLYMAYAAPDTGVSLTWEADLVSGTASFVGTRTASLTGVENIAAGFTTDLDRFPLQAIINGAATLAGDSSDNSIISTLADNTIYGRGGDDELRAFSAVGSIMRGGDGNDTIVSGPVATTLTIGATTTPAFYFENSGTRNSELYGDGGDDVIRFSSLSTTYTTTASGGLGDDTFIIDQIDANAAAFTINGGGHTDSIDLSGIQVLNDPYTTNGGFLVSTGGNFGIIDNSRFSHNTHIVGAVSNLENITGTDREDILIGGSEDNVLFGGDGDDDLRGGGGSDTLLGGDGYDQITAGINATLSEHVTIDGGPGFVSDSLEFDVSNVGGSDLFTISYNADGTSGTAYTQYGGGGSSSVQATFTKIDRVSADANRVFIDASLTTTGVDYQQEGFSISQYDLFAGGSGDDKADLDDGDNQFASGGAGRDFLSGRGSNLTLNGDDGDDNLSSSGGSGTLNGGNGNDHISSAGTHTLNGGAGDDILRLAFTAGGNINGGDGNDSIAVELGYGATFVSGGAGTDEFLVAARDGGGTNSVGITDLDAGNEHITIRSLVADPITNFADLVSNHLIAPDTFQSTGLTVQLFGVHIVNDLSAADFTFVVV